MDLTKLVARLPERQTNSIYFYEKGRAARRTHAEVYGDVRAAADRLAGWGVRPGMRVGIRAPNSYQWIVYDLALIETRAVSVAFTEDFDAATAEELRARYDLSLLLVSSAERTSPMAITRMSGSPTTAGRTATARTVTALTAASISTPHGASSLPGRRAV